MIDMGKETARSSVSAAEPRRRAAKGAREDVGKSPSEKIRVFVAAENRLLRDALARVLCKGGYIEVIATKSAAPFHTSALLEARPDILLLTSRGSLEEDLAAIREVRAAAPAVRILLIGMAKDEREFLQLCGLASAATCCATLRPETFCKVSRPCMLEKRYAPGRYAPCCFATLNLTPPAYRTPPVGAAWV